MDTPLCKKGPTHAAEATKYVRKAMSCVTPREAIYDEMYNGLSVPHYSFRSPPSFGFNPDLKLYPYNLTRATKNYFSSYKPQK